VYVTAPGADINAATPTRSNVAFTEYSPFLEITEGDYQIRLTTVGSKDPVFDSGTVPLDAGSIFTAVAVDATGGASPISLIVLTNDPTTPFIEIDDKSPTLRVLHGSPDAPNVDVLVDDVILLANVPYKTASEFLLVASGSRNIKVNAAGTSTTVINADLNFVLDSFTTIIATDFLAQIVPLVLSDENTPPSGNILKIRVVHSAPSAPPVDVYVTAPGADINAATPTLSNVAFTEFSPFLEIPEDDYQIRVTAAGSKDPVFDSGTVTLEAGSILTAVAVDATSGESPISLVVLTNDPTTPFIEIDDTPRIRAVHASPDAPNVDILVDNDIVVSDVAFKGVLDYTAVPAGDRNIKVNGTGTATSVIDVTVPLAGGTDYTVLAVNFVASIEPLLLDDNTTPPTPGNAKVRVVHASPDAPNVDVLVDDTIVLTDVAFKEFSDYLEVPAGARNFKVNATGTATTVIDVTPPLVDGGIYTVVALNTLANIEPLLLLDN
jgi:hypothetical protein